MANVVRIFEQQFETLKKMPKKDQPKMALAMLEFAFTGTVSVDLNYIQDLALTPMKPSLKLTQTGGCPKGVVRNPAGLNQYSEVKGYPNSNPNSNPNGNPKSLVKSFINNTSPSISSSVCLEEDVSNLPTARAKFVPPTEDEVMAYVKQMSLSAGTGGFDCCPEQARLFFAYYDNANWKDKNGTPILNWQKSFKVWVRQDQMRQYERSQKC